MTTTFVACAEARAAAHTAHPGGVAAPADTSAGGVEYGTARRSGPILETFDVQRTVAAGRLPRIVLRLSEAGARTIAVRVEVMSLALHRPVLSVELGWIHTHRSVLVRWPRPAVLSPGAYKVSLAARDHAGRRSIPSARISSQASFTVASPPAPKPALPTPKIPAATGAVFPVQGPHSYGGPENRFGAPRAGHIHQGQDILAAEGTPVVAPLAGVILVAGNQPSSAGFYVVEHTGAGLDFMFAHCQAASLAVSEGQTVLAGQPLCKVGQTGDATTPHLHFEIWVGGWRTKSGEPIDPLPYLQEWDRSR